MLIPKLTRILLVIDKVNESGSNWLQKMLLQEDMHQVAGMKTLILKDIYHVLRKELQNELFSSKVLLCGGDQRLKGILFAEVCDKNSFN